MRVVSAEEVRAVLTYALAIEAVRGAMIALSAGTTRQLLRSILPVSGETMLGVMPGGLGEGEVFGAKLISVSPGNTALGRPSHQGLVVLFDPDTGAPACVMDATEITAIRTGAASAVATDALARPAARVLAILGTGEQARSHARAILRVRPVLALRIWGRDPEKAASLAEALAAELGCEVTAAATVQDAVRDADIICTVTGAAEPILQSAWVADGAHVNVVGSSHAAPVEIDNALVVRARFIADSREGVLAQGAEFLRARQAGLIDDDHIAAEIGEVLSGAKPGRTNPAQVTIYKSLGHIVQDLASAQAVLGQLERSA